MELDVDLPRDVVNRIRGAIQRVVLTELATTDIAPTYSLAVRDPYRKSDDFGPETDGVWIREGEWT